MLAWNSISTKLNSKRSRRFGVLSLDTSIQECIRLKANCPLLDRTLIIIILTLRWPWPGWLYLYHKLVIAKKFGVQQSKKPILPKYTWPWPNHLDTQTRPIYGYDVPPYQKWSFYVKAFKKLQPKQADRYTDIQAVWKHYIPAYEGGKNKWLILRLWPRTLSFYLKRRLTEKWYGITWYDQEIKFTIYNLTVTQKPRQCPMLQMLCLDATVSAKFFEKSCHMKCHIFNFNSVLRQ